MLVTSKELLLKAQKEGYAVGAFNIENMEMAMAVILAADELNAPVIIQTTPGTIKYSSLSMYLSMVKSLADKVKIPVAMHLDHSSSYQLAKEAFETGYTSIMIDGSKLPFEENIALTKSVVDLVDKKVPIEGELGKVGGKEDDLVSDENIYTDPKEAEEFVLRTNVDSLAVGVGTSHGIYKVVPKVNIEVLKKIKEVVSIPLVLHGTFGVPNEQVIQCIKNGICKVNYATDLRIAYTRGVKKYLEEDKDVYDPKKYGKYGIEEVKKYVKEKIVMLGSNNRY